MIGFRKRWPYEMIYRSIISVSAGIQGLGDRSRKAAYKKPEQSAAIKRIFSRNIAASKNQGNDSPKDYRTAELVVNLQPITEAVVAEFAKAKQIEELIVSIAQLSRLSTTKVERLFLGTWSSPVAVIFKAIGFRLTTIDVVYRACLTNNAAIHEDLTCTKAEFIALSRSTAKRIMRFYLTRKSVEFGAAPGEKVWRDCIEM